MCFQDFRPVLPSEAISNSSSQGMPFRVAAGMCLTVVILRGWVRLASLHAVSDTPAAAYLRCMGALGA